MCLREFAKNNKDQLRDSDRESEISPLMPEQLSRDRLTASVAFVFFTGCKPIRSIHFKSSSNTVQAVFPIIDSAGGTELLIETLWLHRSERHSQFV
uniref:AlNc14C475G11857 protein n=1 Tax=Albugo laibachii Nc14 TaxID=890382 RepID=F0X0C0_9STRA|nr:AlNc14C475G11857 [Albugo laibachii Nc14]|eukprot:CCA27203.1 AlNc14C475G11857 [Albugo laibachii Nc14]